MGKWKNWEIYCIHIHSLWYIKFESINQIICTNYTWIELGIDYYVVYYIY